MYIHVDDFEDETIPDRVLFYGSRKLIGYRDVRLQG